MKTVVNTRRAVKFVIEMELNSDSCENWSELTISNQLKIWCSNYPPIVGGKTDYGYGNCWQECCKDLIQDPPTENDVNLHSMITIRQFSQHIITVSDVVEFDEILGKINRPKVNQFVCYKSRKISTVPLLHIFFMYLIAFCKVSKRWGLTVPSMWRSCYILGHLMDKEPCWSHMWSLWCRFCLEVTHSHSLHRYGCCVFQPLCLSHMAHFYLLWSQSIHHTKSLDFSD